MKLAAESMDIRKLEIFCKVVELKSFTRAAEALFLSQPTVSEHIRALEESHGVRFVDRLGREALPTEAGRILYRYARRILRLRDESVQAIEQFSGKLIGHLYLGASTIPGTYLLPELAGAFKARYPDIEITVKIAGSQDIAESVLEGALELGFIGARWSEAALEWREVFDDELVLAVYPEHPWRRRRFVKVEDLAKEPFIVRERHSGTRRIMEGILEKKGLPLSRLRIVAEMGSTEAVRQAVKARIGVSILSRRAVAEDVARGMLRAVPVKGVSFKRPIYLVKRKRRECSPLCATFAKFLDESAKASPSR